MTLPKKASRGITIDGMKYRWRVISDMKVDTCTILFVHEYLEDHGQALKLTINDTPTLKPKHVRIFIKHSLASGWDPRAHGKGFYPVRLSSRQSLQVEIDARL